MKSVNKYELEYFVAMAMDYAKKITFSREESHHLTEELLVVQFKSVGMDMDEDYFRRNIRSIIDYFDKRGNIQDTIKYYNGARYIGAYKN